MSSAGPSYGCPSCAWSESEEYDLSGGKDPVDEKGGAIDHQAATPPGSSRALAYPGRASIRIGGTMADTDCSKNTDRELWRGHGGGGGGGGSKL